ncbi:NAD-dependent epimerase/dehydratase family protein [Candidatus Chloroploca sp. M-50]|uniref:NAD-dependent epimerase/dehydratase family protein n=1 Tax=Candidatus Chloroploca mongolica TaxID=2528176 RepID=A0ABS4D899_9CHLR|nr:NAD-dependent epimerase/dehydratase family protein [Candidatus Chloroploca mongolica]MBP1465668.1 NAD-dependent epimerase/dehydratase family protein [Candidatus Chloroploca mongolica]
MTRVLINGIDSHLGAQVAQRLSVFPEVSIIGVGRKTPPAPVGRADWLLAHLSGLQMVELLRAEAIDVVVQLAFVENGASREEAVQQNVLGSMELLGACAKADVQRVVLRSHTALYGASPLNPTYITEHRPLAKINSPGWLRDVSEVEHFSAEFAARHPQLSLVSVRCAPLIGDTSPLVTYLRQPNPSMLAGFDPCFQLLHLEDAAAGFALAALSHAPGPFNLASSDTICLSQAIKLAGGRPNMVLEPVVSLAFAMGNRAILGRWPFELSFLRHSCIVDTCRAHGDLGWNPEHSAVDALMALQADEPDLARRELAAEALRAFLERRSEGVHDE